RSAPAKSCPGKNWKTSNPCPNPKGAMRKGLAVKPSVRYPAAWSASANVVMSDESTSVGIGSVVGFPVIVSGKGVVVVTALCAVGYSPLIRDATDAFVYGA